jgi:hypothetical protein
MARADGGPAALLALAAVLVGCAPIGAQVTYPPLGVTPAPAGDATAAARTAVTTALGQAGLQVVDPTRAVRPPEGPRFAAAPRTVVRATLPDDPDGGYIVLYAFGSASDADAAAKEQAAYVASGPGRVQFSPGTRFVIQVLDSTAIFFAWSPESSPDRRTGSIEDALHAVGTAIPVPG